MMLRLCICSLAMGFAVSAQAQMRPGEIEVADPFGQGDTYDPEQRNVPPGDRPSSARAVPDTHTVKQGDTLWGITGTFMGDAWQWPRVWSYNPEITNPHWIYPGAVVRLKLGAEGEKVTTLLSGTQVKIKASKHKDNSVFLRDEGYIERDAMKAAGVIAGANEEHMLLAYDDKVYVHFDDPKFAKAGNELAIFAEIPSDQRLDDEEGQLVRIFGTARIDDYDPDTKVSRAVITEALDPIERGYKVAPIRRKFLEVEPRTNRKGIQARVVATMRPQLLVGDYGVVFVDVGREDGVQVGNRFLVVRSGDAWQKALDDNPKELGATAELPKQPKYPDEAIAELRVVDVRKKSAMCLVTSSLQPVAMQDRAEMPKGY